MESTCWRFERKKGWCYLSVGITLSTGILGLRVCQILDMWSQSALDYVKTCGIILWQISPMCTHVTCTLLVAIVMQFPHITTSCKFCAVLGCAVDDLMKTFVQVLPIIWHLCIWRYIRNFGLLFSLLRFDFRENLCFRKNCVIVHCVYFKISQVPQKK